MGKINNDELESRVLEIGKKYKKADKPIKIEVGKIMTSKRRITKRKKNEEDSVKFGMKK